MIARVTSFFVALEVLGYFVLGMLLVQRWQVDGSQVAAIIISLWIVARVAMALPTFIVATACRIRARAPIVNRDILIAQVKETFAKPYFYTIAQPFERWIMGPDPRPAGASALPVLLVHGYLCNRGVWQFLRGALSKRLPNPLFTINLEPPFARIDDYVPQLEARIREIFAEAGSTAIIIVAYSMGGLVARACLARGGEEGRRIMKLITLASPHHGTQLATFAFGDNARELRCDGGWLAQLAAQERARPITIPVASIYAENDDIVYPPESARLPGARNVPLAAIGHMSLLVSSRVAALITEEIRAA